jgi:hypothetical protein
MKSYDTFEKTVEVTEVVGITCNFCGKFAQDEGIFCSDITSFDIEPGFGSMFDCDTISLEICDECLVKLTRTCVIPPTWKKM